MKRIHPIDTAANYKHSAIHMAICHINRIKADPKRPERLGCPGRMEKVGCQSGASSTVREPALLLQRHLHCLGLSDVESLVGYTNTRLSNLHRRVGTGHATFITVRA